MFSNSVRFHFLFFPPLLLFPEMVCFSVGAALVAVTDRTTQKRKRRRRAVRKRRVRGETGVDW